MSKQRLRNDMIWIMVQIYGYMVSVWDDEKVLEMNGGDAHTSI